MTDPTRIEVDIPAALLLAMQVEADREGTCVEDIVIDALVRRYEFPPNPECN